MELFFTILMAAITWFNYQFYRKAMAPSVLFGLVWTASLGLHAFFSVTLLDKIYPLSLATMILFTSGVVAFSTGSLLYNLYFMDQDKTYTTTAELSYQFPPFSFIMRLFLVLFCLVILPFYVQKAIELFIKSQVDNFFVGLRVELTYGDEGMGPLKYMVNISTFVYALCQMESIRFKSRRNSIITTVSIILALIYAVLFTGRTYFIMLGTIYLGIQIMYNPNFKLRKIFWVIPVVLIFFTFYGLLYEKGGSLDDSFASNLKSSSQNTALYFSGSLSAFDYEQQHDFRIAYTGYNSLRFFYVTAIAMGLIETIHFDDNLIQDFVSIPYETNVFTFYSPYMRDFGYLYPIILLLLLGVMQTWLYMKARFTGSPRFVLYYSILLYPLIISFFQDQYFSIFSIWLQSVIIVEAAFFVNKLFVRVELNNATSHTISSIGLFPKG